MLTALFVATAIAMSPPVHAAGDDPVSAHGLPPALKAQPFQALHYGQVLFDFFQDKHFSALTGLVTSQHFGRLAAQSDETEILRGNLLLSYGVHGQAGQIFAALIDRGSAPSTRDRAWFYLSKIRYQRGRYAEAEAALARIVGKLPQPLDTERNLLWAQLLMARGDYARAADVLGSMPAATAGPFARFNLGVALIKSGDVARGTAWLDKIGTTRADNEEQRSLRDRANVALGVAALNKRHADDARRALERVRLNSIHTNQALLGLGWAAAAQWQPARALVPWNELATRDASDPAVLEVLLARPYAHAELGAYGTSLREYRQALAAFALENQRLDASIAAIRAGKLIDALLERNPAAELGWFGDLRELPAMPHAAHLSQVLARHEFQEAFKNLRDLRFLETRLRQWRGKLDRFRDLPENQRQSNIAELTTDRDSRAERPRPFDERIEALAQQVETELLRVAAISREQQVAAEQIAAAALVTQQERLRVYTAQAQFEVAQLIDRAALSGKDDHGQR